jgi:putative flavoprotein involved in K+ transport
MTESVQVAIVGAGQAGLSVSYGLKQRGISHCLLEQHRVGHAWREERWDSFCLVTPNWQCQLPGFTYAGKDPEGFMQKDEIVDYLERYVQSFAPPVREGVSVRVVRSRSPRAGFELETSQGRLHAAEVVIATGGYHTPRVPSAAQKLPSSIFQVHSANYKNPQQLPDGAVLVVGTGQSGAQIAEDLQLAGRKVHLCVGNAPRCARRYRGRDVVEWLELMGHYDVPITQQANPDQAREKTNHYVTGRSGGHDLDLRAFASEGMSLYGPLLDIDERLLHFAPELARNLDAADDVYVGINRAIDEYITKAKVSAPPGARYVPLWQPVTEIERLDYAKAGISAVVWCTGFDSRWEYIELPVFDERGHPRHLRGVTAVPGLSFVGLPWLHTWGSGRFAGIARDADYLVAIIAERLRASQRQNPHDQFTTPS